MCGISTYTWTLFGVNVGGHIPDMEHLGNAAKKMVKVE